MKGYKLYGFGRIIDTETKIGNFPKVILVYIYNSFSSDKNQIPELKKEDLLIPPLGTNQKPWTEGIFEKIKESELKDDDILKNHCFRDFRGKLFDEKGNEIQEEFEPIGEYGLQNHLTINDLICEAISTPNEN